MSAVLVNDGRVLLAEAIKNRPSFLGLGTGEAAWSDDPPPPPASLLELVTPVGYKAAKQVSYVTPDEAGEIVLPTGKYNYSETPTNYLYYKFDLDYADGGTSDLREWHVYVDAATVVDLPVAQTWFTPEQMQVRGRLLLAERRKPMPFDSTVRAVFEFVVIF